MTALAILFWMGCGAAIGIGAMAFFIAGKGGDDAIYAPYAERLGKPCWMNEGGEYSKFRVVAVSHKGSIAVRRWDDDSGKHAKWIRHGDIGKGDCVYFDEGGNPMSARVDRCDRCKRPFGTKPRKKLSMMRETGSGFSSDQFARYYCPKCAEEAKKAVRRFETEGFDG